MNKILLITIFLLSMNTYGQKLIKSPYEARMDSIAMTKLHFTFTNMAKKERIATWRPYHWVKFTFKTRLNSNVTQKIKLCNGVSDMFSDLDTEDYWSIGAYDARVKFYLTKKVRLVGRCFVTGVQSNTYLYTCGLNIKF